MRQIQFYIAGVELGPFDEEQVVRYFRDGLLSLSDLARDEGDKDWMPLRTLLAKRPLPDIKFAPATPAAPRTLRIELGPLPDAPKSKFPIVIVPKSKILNVGSRAASARVTDKLPVVETNHRPKAS